MDKCREEFEIFWTARCCGLGIECVLTRLINGDYCDIKAYYAWIGWKESRESMKAIKLPERIQLDRYYTNETDRNLAYNCALFDCKISITSAGYKVE